jgi:hypothetical protein
MGTELPTEVMLGQTLVLMQMIFLNFVRKVGRLVLSRTSCYVIPSIEQNGDCERSELRNSNVINFWSLNSVRRQIFGNMQIALFLYELNLRTCRPRKMMNSELL